MDKNGEGVPKMTHIYGNRLTVGELINVLRRTDFYYDRVLLDLTGIGKGFVEVRNWTRMDCGEDKACLALAWQGGGKAYTVEDLMRVIYWGEMERWFTNDTRVIILDSETNTFFATGVTDHGSSGMVIEFDGIQGGRKEGGER